MLKKFDITCAIFVQSYLRKREDTYSMGWELSETGVKNESGS